MKIVVHEGHIAEGTQIDSMKCPIARAIATVVGSSCVVGTWRYHHRQTVAYHKDGLTMVAPLPPVAIKAMETFDDTGEMEPFEFEIEWGEL